MLLYFYRERDLNLRLAEFGVWFLGVFSSFSGFLEFRFKLVRDDLGLQGTPLLSKYFVTLTRIYIILPIRPLG